MKNAIFTGSIRQRHQMNGDSYDRGIAAIMDAHGLGECVASDGCFYPVVRALPNLGETQRWAVLDPYTSYKTECEMHCKNGEWHPIGGDRDIEHLSGNIVG